MYKTRVVWGFFSSSCWLIQCEKSTNFHKVFPFFWRRNKCLYLPGLILIMTEHVLVVELQFLGKKKKKKAGKR